MTVSPTEQASRSHAVHGRGPTDMELGARFERAYLFGKGVETPSDLSWIFHVLKHVATLNQRRVAEQPRPPNKEESPLVKNGRTTRNRTKNQKRRKNKNNPTKKNSCRIAGYLNRADKTQKYTKPVDSIPHGFV
jgi:hypothetical protein